MVSGRYDHRNRALARQMSAKTKKNPGHVNQFAKLKNEEAIRVAVIRLGLDKQQLGEMMTSGEPNDSP